MRELVAVEFDKRAWEAAGRSFEAASRFEGATREALYRAGRRYVEKAFGVGPAAGDRPHRAGAAGGHARGMGR